MVTPVDPTSAAAGLSEIQMRSPVAPGTGIGLSEAAQQALARIAEMQVEYRADAAAAQGDMQRHANPVSEAENSTMEDLAARLVQQMETSARVQQQIAEFTMAASISSSFGRDLNMFLRGQ